MQQEEKTTEPTTTSDSATVTSRSLHNQDIVIFLDVDGVLHSVDKCNNYLRLKQKHKKEQWEEENVKHRERV